MADLHTLSGITLPVLFLKAIVHRQITVPTFIRRDGAVVPTHTRMVMVSTDHDDARVLSGQGSHSQRQAHAELSRNPAFHQLPHDDQVAVLLAHATDQQVAASRSAALSGWKQRANAGQNPTRSQWEAFYALSLNRKMALMDAVTAAVGNTDHLTEPGLPASQATLAHVAAVDTAIAVPAPAVTPDIRPSTLVFRGVLYRRSGNEWEISQDGESWGAVRYAPAVAALNRGDDPNSTDARVRPPAERGAALVAAIAVPSRLVGAVASAPAAASGGSPAARTAAMAAVQVPTFPDTSESNRGTTRRAGQLQAFARSGDYDAVANFPTSRTRSNYAALDDYRLALLAAAQNLTAPQASAAMRHPVPRPPDITGANMQNTALLAAKRKCAMLYAASRDADPVPALLAVTTSRGNRYLNAADDYKRELLAHFGHNVAGDAVPGASPENGVTGSSPTPTVRATTPTVARPAAAPDRPAAAAPVPDSQNPAIAANPLGLSEAMLGFVPRPNVPMSVRTNDGNFRHADPRVVALNRRYLAQSTALQSQAREYQSGTWRPPVPRTPAEIESERVATAAIQAAEMAAIRAAAAQVEARMGSVEEIFKPRSVVGANIRPIAPLDESTKASLQTFFRMPSDQAVELMKGMVADYDTPGKFSMRVTSNSGEGAQVHFSKDDGTEITRKFSRSSTGIKVYHAYFKAGRTGNGSGKHLFRCSMGAYKVMGVTEVSVTANIDVGGYAWARFGYKPKDWASLRTELSGRLLSLTRGMLAIQVTTNRPDGTQGRVHRQIGALTPAQASKVQAVLNMNSDTALWALADMRVGERQVGKELLLGTCWGGVMKLSDAAVMKRFTKYVKPEDGGRNA